MNIIELLGIKTELLTPEKTVISVKVSEKLMQPYGIVHGGINALLAETAASLAAKANLPLGFVPIGVDIQTHHLKSVSAGQLIATAVPINIGNTLQVWSVTICEYQSQQLTSTSTVTVKKHAQKN
ncbi:PaaI family thioesterase [Leuconostoc palmae]|uniref:PaaI family thioesterase n=1 Tax=Leuconostoc palmae TaxID=501487 RepID=UPI001C7DC1E8|nr:PaaI family thioesterase [Leuconostoc palmae]